MHPPGPPLWHRSVDAIDGDPTRRGIESSTAWCPAGRRDGPTTPKAPPVYMKDAAFVAALQTIFIEYRQFIAYASNI